MVKLASRFLLASLLVSLAIAPAYAGTITLTNSTTANLDASSANRSVLVTALTPGFGTGIILDVDISINFAKADGEAFDPPYPGGTPFHNEIHFRLDSPLATLVELISAGSFNSGSALFDGTITFDQDAAAVVNANLNQPSAGTFRPIGNLNLFNGQSALGNWNLFIEDTVGADSLRFRNYELTITTEDAAIPEPSTLLLFGSGLAAVARWRRKR